MPRGWSGWRGSPPDIVEAILVGRQPAGLKAYGLMRDTRIPIDWQEQREALGFV